MWCLVRITEILDMTIILHKIMELKSERRFHVKTSSAPITPPVHTGVTLSETVSQVGVTP